MEENVLYDLGIDIKSDLSFRDGDLILAKYSDNIVQSIANRLNCNLNELEYYEDYGSVISSFLGWKRNDETIGLIESEFENVLKADSRISSFNYSIEYDDKLIIKLTLFPNTAYSISASYEITNNGVEVIDTTDEEEE